MAGKTEWRRGSKRHMISQAAKSGKSRKEAFLELRQLTEQGIEPMVFKRNVSGTRVAKPLSLQLLELKHEINRVYKLMAIAGRDLDTKNEDSEISNDFEIDELQDDLNSDENDSDDSDSDSEDDEEEEEEIEEKKPRASGKQKLEDAKKTFLAEVRRIRNFCDSRAISGEVVDRISLRPVVAAAKLIPAGVPIEALLNVIALHWPDGAKHDASIPNFDFVKFSKGIMKERGIENGEYHDLFGYALLLAEHRIPIMAVGPFGTGKSFLAHQLADYLKCDYAETPMSSGATRGDLLGRHTNKSFITAEFEKIYVKGGIFNFEELDASDSGMIIVLNNALASEMLYNSMTGERLKKNANFIPFSTANTWGLGATREYVARERMDAATIDRWRMGRIYVPLDEKIEESILFGSK